LGACPCSIGVETNPFHPAGCSSDFDLAANLRHLVGRAGVVAPNIRDDLQRIGATGQHPANGPHQRPKFLQASNRITCALPQGCHKHVAHGVSGQFTIAGEAELQDVCPAPFPLVVGAQSRERHPQIAGGQDPEIPPQPAARSAIVSNAYDGSDLIGDLAKPAQTGRQSVPAAQGDD
jgi:hypothetical protein